MRYGRGTRSGAVTTVLAVAAALLSTPLAHADGSQGAKGVRLDATAIAKLSQRYENRVDGTPGQVAAQQGSAASAPLASAPTGASGDTTATAAAGSTPGFARTGQWETARGFAEPTALPGTPDWVAVFSGGTVGRYDAAGHQVWNRPATSLVDDWKVTATNWYQPYPFNPNLYVGYNPYQMSVTGRHPYVTGDFNGDGTDDVAVAYAVGDSPARPFTSPGSQLNTGTFVTVLDGATGRTLWSKLLPGYVGTMLVQAGRLIVADATGPSWSITPVREQGDSRSNLTSYRFTPAADGKLTGTAVWTYSTKAPWARWGDLVSLGSGEIAASWSDTPMGLGTPRPADGNVLVLDAGDGSVTMHAKTPGYPRMLAKDPSSGRVLVVEQRDPFDVVGWDLTAFDPQSGTRSVIASREGTIPEAFELIPHARGHFAAYAVAELGINADLTDGQSTVSGWDEQGNTVWSYTTASTVGGPNAPTVGLTYNAQGNEVLATVSDPTGATAATPAGPEHSQLIGFDAASGRIDWKNEGAVAGDTVALYQGKPLTVGFDDTAYTVDAQNGKAQAMPLAGDPYAVVSVDVNGDGVKDLVAGGQSRGLFAVDGRTLKNPTPKVLWTSTVDGSVHSVQLLPHAVGGAVAVATDDGFAVVGLSDGRVERSVRTGGFVASLTVAGDGHGGDEIVVPGGSLTAYRPDGTKLWGFQPDGTSGKSLVFTQVTTDASGHLLLEYGGTSAAGPISQSKVTDPAPTAVSLDPATGTPLWTRTTNDPGAMMVDPTTPALASADIPGADGHGVAFGYYGLLNGTKHLVQILDDRTGEVRSSHESPGPTGFLSFVASKKSGLVELNTFSDTVYPADGSAPYVLQSYLDFQSGVLARSVGGTEALVGAEQGLYSYDAPLPKADGFTRENATDFALSAFQVQAADLGDGAGDDMIGYAADWRAIGIPLQALGGDAFVADYHPHGLTTYKLSEDQPARIPTAGGTVASAAPQADSAAATPAVSFTSSAVRSASPLAGLGMPVSSAALPIEVQHTDPTAQPQSVGADNTAETTRGYTPQQLQARLGLTGDGTGQTVAIVDAYHYPTAEADLDHFAAHFGLPQTCGSAGAGTDCFDFQQVYADGTAPEVNSGWNEEAALDIEWVHSVAPHAKIVLVEAKDSTQASLSRAEHTAAALHPAAVSNSWGATEFSEEAFYDGDCKLADSVCVQSTGDNGYPSGYSATSPYVLAIGGTNLQLDAAGNTLGETAWSSTGGGLSYFEPRPAYQDGVSSSPLRATPDVSMVADPRTGVPVYLTMATASGTLRSMWLEVGGTSLSAPIWGGIMAATDQLRAAAGKPHLASAGPDGDTAHGDVYALGSSHLRDITSGSNGRCGAECTAGPGYDTVTGLGSPTAGVDAALAAMK